MKPYQRVAICECHEVLVEIPSSCFAMELPHPYIKLLAPYGDKSPYYLRQGVLERLLTAQRELQTRHPGWRIQIFDAYRPIAVQQFMVEYAFQQALRTAGLNDADLTEKQRQAILEQVYQFWAVPSLDSMTPPPHSTGAAVDVTLVNASGQVINMGSAIDEMSPRSHPDYYAAQAKLTQSELSQFHHNRQLLKSVMTAAGFRQHPNEWWHFSYGDQLWAWLIGQSTSHPPVACYGAI